ncbi:MAG: hypothetical protein KDA84_16065 [Planctomycetaceae bacterium]|nr:hypothetical protein [Planctomycetaceae bacterium]
MTRNVFVIETSAVYSDGEVRLGLGLTSATLARARRGNTFLYLGQWLLDWLEEDAEARQSAKSRWDHQRNGFHIG